MKTRSTAFEEERNQHGLGFNIEHVLALTGWSYAQVAEQMYPLDPPEGVNHISARKGLAQVIERKQKHWRRHLPALAGAWDLPAPVLLYDDLRRCITLDALEERYGFRRSDVAHRWERHQRGLFNEGRP
jgi:hypothetical protein